LGESLYASGEVPHGRRRKRRWGLERSPPGQRAGRAPPKAHLPERGIIPRTRGGEGKETPARFCYKETLKEEGNREGGRLSLERERSEVPCR